MKRTLAMLLTLCMLFGLLPLSAFADEDTAADYAQQPAAEETYVADPENGDTAIEEDPAEVPDEAEPVPEEAPESVEEQPAEAEEAPAEDAAEESQTEAEIVSIEITKDEAIAAKVVLSGAYAEAETVKLAFASADGFTAEAELKLEEQGVYCGEITFGEEEHAGEYKLSAMTLCFAEDEETVFNTSDEECPELLTAVALSTAAEEPAPEEAAEETEELEESAEAETAEQTGEELAEEENELEEDPEPATVEITVPDPGYIISGGSLQLSYTTTATADSIEWSVQDPDSEEGKGSACADITALGKLVAKTVTEQHTLTVKVNGYNGTGDTVFTGTKEIKLYPKLSSISILDETGTGVTGKTIVYDINDEDTTSMTFSVLEMPYHGDEAEPNYSSVSWKWSDTTNKFATYTVNEGGTITISDPVKAGGTVTFTATAVDRDLKTKKTATVKVNFQAYPSGVTITNTPEEDQLRGGASWQLKATIDDEVVTNSGLVWSVDYGSAYASISSSGKLTTKAVYAPQKVTVSVHAKANESAKDEIDLTLLPAVTNVYIKDEDDTTINGKTVPLDFGETCNLSATVLPDTASGDVKWSSSNTAVASVDEDGKVTTFTKAGTATIKATAADGSGKSASVTVKVAAISKVGKITGSDSVTSGGKVTLKAALYADEEMKTAISGGKVYWSSSDENIATVASTDKASASVVVTAKQCATEKTVTISAAAEDGGATNLEFTLTVKPKANTLYIVNTDGTGISVNNTTIYREMSVDEETGKAVPEAITLGANETGVKWSVSNTARASCDPGPSGTTEVTLKTTGSVKLTATSSDGKRKASVTICGIVPVDDVTITAQNYESLEDIPALASGKGSVTLIATASPDNATSRNVVWSIPNSAEKSYATLKASGNVCKVTAAAGLKTPVTVTVRATSKDGKAYSEVTLTINPVSSAVSIINGTYFLDAARKGVYQGDTLNGRTITVNLNACSEISLSATVYPTDAGGLVTWKTSNAAAAGFVDEDDNLVKTVEKTADPQTLTLSYPGTATITATAADGSGKSVSFKIVTVRYASRICFKGNPTAENPYTVKGGKTLKLSPLFAPEYKYNGDTEAYEPTGQTVTNKAVTYSLREADKQYASVSSSGVVTAKKVTADTTICVKVSYKLLPDYVYTTVPITITK